MEVTEEKKHLTTLVELGLWDHAEIWSSTFGVDLLIDRFYGGLIINWFRLDGEQDNSLVIYYCQPTVGRTFRGRDDRPRKKG